MRNEKEPVKRMRWGLAAMFLAVLHLNGAWSQDRQSLPTPSPRAEMLSLTEAEILIYLLPEARQTRNNGMDIGWELETGPPQNTMDFYNFWVVNNERKVRIGSVTIGHFSVNKHTGDVWDQVSDKLISSDEELQGIQKILREGHHIDAQIVARYRNLKPMR